MPIPSYKKMIEPLLRALAAKPAGMRTADARSAVADAMELTPEDRALMLPKGSQPIYANRIGWAHDRLKRAGYSQAPQRGLWQITSAGLDVVGAHPQQIPDDVIESITIVEDDDILEIEEDDRIGLRVEGIEAVTPEAWKDYPLDALSIRDERRTAIDVVRRIADGRFVLDPDFQRAFVWDREKQSRLIESILMRIPLPVFYVAESDTGSLIVVDGRQRLTTFDRFLSNKLILTLPSRPDLDGKSFSQLETKLKNRVEDCQLLFFIIDSKVPDQARLDIFERVNGGEPLSRQQMRNAIYRGPATTFLREQSETVLFKSATAESLNVASMQDREFVNRFCSFMLLNLETYKGDMDDWLARGLKHLNSNPAEIPRIKSQFDRALENNFEVFGGLAFRRHQSVKQTRRGPINAALFDVMSTGLCRYEQAVVRAKRDELRAAFYQRMSDESYVKSITYGPNAPKTVRERFRFTDEILREVFGD